VGGGGGGGGVGGFEWDIGREGRGPNAGRIPEGVN